jgi:prevent-host-death family protein
MSVRDLKTHLSEWLGRVQAGGVVEVTSHRKPIARTTGIRQPESTDANPQQKALTQGSSAGMVNSESSLHLCSCVVRANASAKS